MSGEAPTKEELTKELQRLLTTLTEEAQHAALRKVSELGFDPNKGRVSLEETLINLSQGRDILLDAIEKGKFVQLPLKLQYVLFRQVEAIARELTALVNGTDAVQNLDASVEELTASVWQFQLHNLSQQVLGFHSKMNQLKSQEIAIRQAGRAAGQFTELRQKADQTLTAISEQARGIGDAHAAAIKLTEQLQATLRESTDTGQKVASIGAQVSQHETTAAQQLAAAKQASAETEAIAAKSKEMRVEIEASRSSLQDLMVKAQELLTATERTTATHLADFTAKYERLHDEVESTTKADRVKLADSVTELTAQTSLKLESLTASADTRVNNLANETSTRLGTAEATQQARLATQLQDFTSRGDAAVQAFTVSGKEAVTAGETDFKRLVAELDLLEGRIREAIERATGYSLFHAFQRRQQDIARAKKFWAWALASCLGLALCASGLFIYSLQFVQVYNAAFYLKLSITIPLVYAIAFCNLQYSRERKLEEEYAFKSSVSISLDPYQKLVATLVDKANPAELSKYTEFIIQSVNRVFSSPTGPVFEGSPSGKDYPEKIIKAMGEVIEPVIKGLKR